MCGVNVLLQRVSLSFLPNKIHRTLSYVLICSVVVLSVFGCSRDHHDHPELTTGEQLFNYHCAECHGEDGTGILFDVMPANILTKKSRQGIIAYITTEGNHERNMPVFKTMPAAEARAITDHLMKLKHIYDTGKKRKPRQLLIEP